MAHDIARVKWVKNAFLDIFYKNIPHFSFILQGTGAH